MERRILFASAFAPLLALTIFSAIASGIAGCGLEEFGLPQSDASVLDGFFDDGANLDSTTGSDAMSGSDATSSSDGSADGSADGGPGDAAPDVGPTSCPTGSYSCGVLGCISDCRACVGSPLQCAVTGRCESSCSACPSHGIECYLCDAGSPVGRCDTTSASECLGANYVHCSCAVIPCLSLAQVCTNVPGQGINNECRTCGEDKTNGGSCGVFQHCDQSGMVCN